MTLYDVAISHASEDDAYAEPLDEALKTHNLVTFHYRQPEAEVVLWGEDLEESLGTVFGSHSRCCVLLVSEHYLNKQFTMLEMAKAKQALPVRLADVQLPDAYADVAFTDWPEEGAEALAQRVVEKLDHLAQTEMDRKAIKRRRRRKMFLAAAGAAGAAVAGVLAQEGLEQKKRNETAPIAGTWSDGFSSWTITEDGNQVHMHGRVPNEVEIAAAGTRNGDKVTAHWDNGTYEGTLEITIKRGANLLDGHSSSRHGFHKFTLRR